MQKQNEQTEALMQATGQIVRVDTRTETHVESDRCHLGVAKGFVFVNYPDDGFYWMIPLTEVVGIQVKYAPSKAEASDG